VANYDVLIIGGGMAGCILATRIAEKGIHPRSGERLRVGLLERGPYFSGNPRPGHGIPLRRKMFTNISSEFRQGARYSMGVFPTVRELILGNSSNRSSGSVRVADAASILGGGSLDAFSVWTMFRVIRKPGPTRLWEKTAWPPPGGSVLS